MPNINQLMLLRKFYQELERLKITPEERMKTMNNIRRLVILIHPRNGDQINHIINRILTEDKTINFDPNNKAQEA
jgi:hypothetical protein